MYIAFKPQPQSSFEFCVVLLEQGISGVKKCMSPELNLEISPCSRYAMSLPEVVVLTESSCVPLGNTAKSISSLSRICPQAGPNNVRPAPPRVPTNQQ